MPQLPDQSHFPGLHPGVYANTPACGLISNRVAQWRREQDQLFLEGGGRVFGNQQKVLSRTRKVLREYLGVANEKGLALVPNFSWGLNALLSGLEGPKEVLVLEDEYPSLLWPFEESGYTIHTVSKSIHTEEKMTEVLKKGTIGILAVSLVQWLDGFHLNMSWLRQIKALYPELTVIADGTQFCGMEAFEFDSSGIDILGSSGYKWMLGGYGNGFFCFSDSVLESVRLSQLGFGSVRGDADRRKEIGLAECLEPGHLDSLAMGSLGEAVFEMQEWSLQALYQQNARLKERVAESFGELGLLDEWVFQRPQQGMIFSVPYSEERWKRLTEVSDISCAMRAGRIRVGFHFYNTTEEVDFISSVLKG